MTEAQLFSIWFWDGVVIGMLVGAGIVMVAAEIGRRR